METPPTVYLRRHGRTAGPFTLEQLQELAAGGSIGPETEAAADPDSPWVALRTLPLGARVFVLGGLKRPDFQRDNTNSGPPIALEDIIAAAQVRKKAGPAAAPAKPVPAEHDVAALLQFNHELEKRRGLFTVGPFAPRKSRRKRDYWLIVGGVGVLFFGVLLAEAVVAVALQTLAARMPDQFWPIFWQVLFHSPILGWGLAMYSVVVVAVTWLMFGLMEDY